MARKKIELVSYEALLEAGADLRLALMEFAPYPKIAKAVHLGRPIKQKSGVSLEVIIDTRPEELGGVPYAEAFNKGSGLYGKKKKKYRIEPNTAGALAFHWEKGMKNLRRLYASRPSKFLGRTEDGRLAFTHVDHPGVHGTNYVKRALSAARPEITKVIKDDVGTSARVYFRQVVKEINQK